jgi:hypothetical protein
VSVVKVPNGGQLHSSAHKTDTLFDTDDDLASANEIQRLTLDNALLHTKLCGRELLPDRFTVIDGDAYLGMSGTMRGPRQFLNTSVASRVTLQYAAQLVPSSSPSSVDPFAMMMQRAKSFTPPMLMAKGVKKDSKKMFLYNCLVFKFISVVPAHKLTKSDETTVQKMCEALTALLWSIDVTDTSTQGPSLVPLTSALSFSSLYVEDFGKALAHRYHIVLPGPLQDCAFEASV